MSELQGYTHYFLQQPNGTGYLLLAVFGVQMLVFILRYLVIAGGSFIVLTLFQDKLRDRKIDPLDAKPEQIRMEIYNSLTTFVVFGLVASLCIWAVAQGWSQMYFKVSDRGWGYFVGSVFLIVIIHDAFFYWAHRLMHWKVLYKATHATHHKSISPTPWASFSFHPWEALLEALIVPLVLFTLPVHPIALFLFLSYMTLINVWGHVGYEFFPQWAAYKFPFSWHNTTFAHQGHHNDQRYNFGLYFLFWDRMFGTLDPNYYQKFDAHFAKREEKK